MAGNCAHCVVGDTGGNCATNPRRVGEKGVKAAIASIIQVNVDSAKVVEHKVANRIGALDGVGVAVEGLEKPWVFGGNELARLLVGPQLVLVVWVQVQARLLRALPVCRYALIDVRLVNDLGYQLQAVVDGARVGGRKFATENGIFAPGGDQEPKQGPYTVYREAEDDDGDEDEYGDAFPHGGCLWSAASFLLGGFLDWQGARWRSRVRQLEAEY